MSNCFNIPFSVVVFFTKFWASCYVFRFEDTTKARQDLADLLLRESEDVSHLCVICGMDEYRLFAHTKDTSLMIHCALCKRWVHAQCQRNFRGYEGNTSAALEKAECVLCKQYKVSFHMNFSTPPNPAAP